MTYLLHLLIFFNIYAILAVSLNLIVGYTGRLTLAHGGYFAIGAYAYALATVKLAWDFAPAALLAAFVSAILSLAISLSAWRFQGDFFVLVTLAVQTLLYSLFQNWSSTDFPLGTRQNLTNGPYGIAGIPHPDIFDIHFDTVGSIAFLSSFLAAGIVICLGMLKASPWGRLLRAIRDDELAARSLGKDARKAKVWTLAIACPCAALAGVIYASYVTYIDPSTASLDQSILLLAMIVVGGTGNLSGPLFGAAVLVVIPELLRLVHLPDASAASVRLLAYGLLLIAIVHFRPQGLAGKYKAL